MSGQGARLGRRERRELAKGPERLIISIDIETRMEMLECGHECKPYHSVTKRMIPASYRRCSVCHDSHIVTYKDMDENPANVIKRAEKEGTLTVVDASGTPRILLSVFGDD